MHNRGDRQVNTDPGKQPPRGLCRYPGCTRPARPAGRRGAPPRYCDLRQHNPRSADKQRARLMAKNDNPPALDPDTNPLELLAYIAELRRELAATAARLRAEYRNRAEAERRLRDHGIDLDQPSDH